MGGVRIGERRGGWEGKHARRPISWIEVEIGVGEDTSCCAYSAYIDDLPSNFLGKR